MIRHSLVAIAALILFSQSIVADADLFMVTEIGVSAQSIRTGRVEGFLPLANTVFENPAGLYRTNEYSVAAFRTTTVDETKYQNLSASYRTPYGVFAVGMMSATVSDITRTQEVFFGDGTSEFFPNGSFSYKNSVTKISYSFSQTKNLHFGTGVSYYSESIDTVNGNGFNFDFGLVYDAYPIEFSASVKNAISSLKMKYNNGQSQNIPLLTTFSTRYTRKRFQVLAQLKSQSRRYLKFIGVNYKPAIADFLEISIGYRERLVVNFDGDRAAGREVVRETRDAITYGVGIQLGNFRIDYAYEQTDHIDTNGSTYLSIGYRK